MNQQQYGAIMEKLGALAATQGAQGTRLEAQKDALDDLNHKFDKHLLNDHAHPPFANGRSRRRVVIDVSKWAAFFGVLWAILETIQAFIIG